MINIKEQESLFVRIGELLKKPIIAYAIGGTAMMLRGLKSTTLDIDLVFNSETSRNKFIEAVSSLGFKESDEFKIRDLRKNIPKILKSEIVRFDLFVNKVIDSTFSEGMKARASQTNEFGKNFVLKIADPSDILIMKSVTLREKDEEDIASLIEKGRVDWKTIIEEAKNQVKLGLEGAILHLGTSLEKLKNKRGVDIPKEVLDELWKVLGKQIEKKKEGK